MARTRNFFATTVDLATGLSRLEAKSEVRYVQCGLFDSREVRDYLRGGDLPNLGLASSGDMNLEPQYLVLDRGSRVGVRSVRQRDGRTRYAIDQLENPDSTVFAPGGRFRDSVLISGRIATIGATAKAIDMHRMVVGTVTAGFRRVGAYWVGHEACAMLESGARLTHAANAPELYDLRPSGVA